MKSFFGLTTSLLVVNRDMNNPSEEGRRTYRPERRTFTTNKELVSSKNSSLMQKIVLNLNIINTGLTVLKKGVLSLKRRLPTGVWRPLTKSGL